MASELIPVIPENVPVGHFVHMVNPDREPKVPTPQLEQLESNL